MTIKTKPPRARVRAIVALLGLLGCAQAYAHAKLVSTVPGADATVSSPKLIQVHFSEAVVMKLSSLKLVASDSNSVSIMAMTDAKDPATLAIMPNAALVPGTYTVNWSVVAADDGHKSSGSFQFTVK